MRKKIVAGNWKMNCDLSEMELLLTGLKQDLPKSIRTKVMVAPSFTNLYQAFRSLRESNIEVVAQNMHQKEEGAFTGEISANMLKSVGVNTVILGHSERRTIFHESDELLAEKAKTALRNEMKIIFCIGEELSDRKQNSQFEVVKSQLTKGLFHFEKSDWEEFILAYEPVWAIGTGETATPAQAQEMHAFIRNLISQKYGETLANKIPILYGGSVKPNNAVEIFAQPDVDGGLIGGAALKADEFTAIILSAENSMDGKRII